MPIKPGDRVSVSLSPQIELAKYCNLKPHATISRDVPEGVDPDAFLAELQADVREVCLQAACTDLGIMNELSEVIASGADLTTYLKKAISHEHPRLTQEERPASAARRKGSKAKA